MHVNTGGFRTLVFKNRGALLVPVALVLIIFGRPSPESAVIGVAIAALGEILRVWAVGYSGVTTRAAATRPAFREENFPKNSTPSIVNALAGIP